jgi:hypothetical protein
VENVWSEQSALSESHSEQIASSNRPVPTIPSEQLYRLPGALLARSSARRNGLRRPPSSDRSSGRQPSARPRGQRTVRRNSAWSARATARTSVRPIVPLNGRCMSIGRCIPSARHSTTVQRRRAPVIGRPATPAADPIERINRWQPTVNAHVLG